MRCIKAYDVAASGLDWLANDKTTTLDALLLTVTRVHYDEVFERQFLVLRILDNKRGGDGAIVEESKGALLSCVDFGQLKVDYRFEQLDNRATEISLDAETDRRSILNLDVEAGERFATLARFNLNFKIKTVLAYLSLNHFCLVLKRLATLNHYITAESVPVLALHTELVMHNALSHL